MLLFRKSLRKYSALVTVLTISTTTWAQGAPHENPLYNPLAILLTCVMIVLLIAIGILANILTAVGDITLLKWKKRKEGEKKLSGAQVAAIFIGAILMSPGVFAQEKTSTEPLQTVTTIGGLTPFVFYVMVSIIFLELLVILALLMNIRFLIRSQKEKLVHAESAEKVSLKQGISWWNRFNKLKPIEQEAELDLGHDYDGIRELNNRLPPWWIYGFYATIAFAGIYLWRYHVSHAAPLSREEYEIAVKKADQKIQDYLKQKGDAVDENTVAMLGASEIAEGKKIFQASCVACHNDGGAGNVGPNLTDDYWLHGGDIKSVFKTIKYGFNAMPTWQNTYSNKQIAQLASYVKSLHGTNPPNAKAPQGELYKDEATVSGAATDSTSAKKEKS